MNKLEETTRKKKAKKKRGQIKSAGGFLSLGEMRMWVFFFFKKMIFFVVS